MESVRRRPWRSTVLLVAAAIGIGVTTVATASSTSLTASPVGASQFTGSDEAALEKSAPTRNGLAAVVVKLDYESLASYDGGIAGLPATSPAVTGDAKLDVEAPESERYLDYAEAQRKAFEARAESTCRSRRRPGQDRQAGRCRVRRA
jgi:hypothetical protein